MQEALPYKRWETLPPIPVAGPTRSGNGNGNIDSTMSNMESLVKDNPVIVFGKRGCCMCHVVRKLLLGLGVNPPVFHFDAEINESFLLSSFTNNNNNNNNSDSNNNVGENSNNSLQFPVVFVGGELFGGLEKVMATHLSGELVPILKQAGALWL